MSEVLLIRKKILEGLKESITNFAKKHKEGSRIAVKLHMGERGALFYLRPIYARTVIDALKDSGLKPFIFDSPTMYLGKRHTVDDYYETAKVNGFTEESVGCPIVITDTGLEVETEIGKLDVCKDLVEADGMVVLSHFKGHLCSSYGGAIKNLGMGGFTSSSKKAIHHRSSPTAENIENCIGCEACVKICPFNIPEVKNGKVIVPGECAGCCACVDVCPNNVLKSKTMHIAKSLSAVVSELLKYFKKENTVYVNVLMDIATRCDCVSHGTVESELELIVPNVGILISNDLVAVDKASLDMANKLSDGKFGKYWNLDAERQTVKAESLGMGSRKYKLIES